MIMGDLQDEKLLKKTVLSLAIYGICQQPVLAQDFTIDRFSDQNISSFAPVFSVKRSEIQTLLTRAQKRVVNSINLDLSGSVMALRGVENEYKILFPTRDYAVGFIHSDLNARGVLDVKLNGSSTALFSTGQVHSSSEIRSKSTGLLFSLKKDTAGRNFGGLQLYMTHDTAELSNKTNIKAGILYSSNNTTEKFYNNSFGYSQNLGLKISPNSAIGFNFSRNKSITANKFSTDTFKIGLSFKHNFQDNGPEKEIAEAQEKKPKLRVGFSEGHLSGEGQFDYNPDQYTGTANYNGIIPVGSDGYEITYISEGKKNRNRIGYKSQHTLTQLSSLGLDNAFGANNYHQTSYTANIRRNMFTFSKEWDFTPSSYLLGGISVGLMEITTIDQVITKSTVKNKTKTTRSPVGSVMFGVGNRFPINNNLNYFVETTFNYLNGRAFSINHETFEFNTVTGIELSF